MVLNVRFFVLLIYLLSHILIVVLFVAISNMRHASPGISQKMTMSILQCCTFTASMILGFTKGWQLTLVILSAIPLVILLMGPLAPKMAEASKNAADAEAKAGEVADEVLTSLRTVTSMNAEEKEFNRYDNILHEVCQVCLRTR